MKRWVYLCAALLGLAGCGNESDSQQRDFFQPLSSLGKRGSEVPLRQSVTPELLAQIPSSVMLIEIPETKVEALVASVGTRVGHETWITQDGVTLSLLDGVLSTTRGFGNDLVNADLDEVLPALRQKSGTAVRLHQYLNGEENVETRAFVCDYSRDGAVTLQGLFRTYQTTQVTEFCKTSDMTLENVYWIEPSGFVRKSRQWLGPFNGFMTLERIKD